MFTKEFYTALNASTLIEIKGGPNRETFLEIWAVEVNGRVFARSWNKSARSWFTAFQEHGIGQLKLGDLILDVRGAKLNADDPLNLKISEAYLSKFTQPQNIKYAEGIAQDEYFNYSMEFFPI